MATKTTTHVPLNNPEYGKFADQLIQTVKEYYRMVRGEVATSEIIEAEVKEIIRSRLK